MGASDGDEFRGRRPTNGEHVQHAVNRVTVCADDGSLPIVERGPKSGRNRADERSFAGHRQSHGGSASRKYARGRKGASGRVPDGAAFPMRGEEIGVGVVGDESEFFLVLAAG